MSNVDALKVCYIKPEGLFQALTEHGEEGNKVFFNGFYLYCVGNEKDDESEEICKLTFAIFMEGIDTRLGYFTITKPNKYCFIEMENSALYYQVMKTLEGENTNMMLFLLELASELGLKYNNITEIEICLDVNTAAISKVKKAIKNLDLEMIVNGTKVANPEKIIKNHKVIFSSTRTHLSKNPTLYFQSNEKDISMKIYDKSKEMQEASPEKIERVEAWDGITENIQRIEVTLKNKQIKHLCAAMREKEDEYKWIDEAIIYLLSFHEERMKAFIWACRKLLYFKEKGRNGKVYDIIDLVQ